ncbi:MAG: hypothetical protein ACYC7E_18380 [Armatimonadota bacterium]
MKYLLLALSFGAVLALLVVVGCRAKETASTTPPTPPPARTTTAPAPAAPAAPSAVTIGPDEAVCPVLGMVMKMKDMTPVQH